MTKEVRLEKFKWDGKRFVEASNDTVYAVSWLLLVPNGVHQLRHELDHCRGLGAPHHPWWHFCGMTASYWFGILPWLGTRHLVSTKMEALELWTKGTLRLSVMPDQSPSPLLLTPISLIAIGPSLEDSGDFL